MKINNKIRLIVIALSLIIVISIAIVCVKNFNRPDVFATVAIKSELNDFNMFYVDFDNSLILNTFQGIIARGSIDSFATRHLHLSQEEKNRIYQKMIEIDFLNYPDTFQNEAIKERESPHLYVFKVNFKNQIKELHWVRIGTSQDEKSEQLMELITVIQGIYQSKDAYKKLPPRTMFAL